MSWYGGRVHRRFTIQSRNERSALCFWRVDGGRLEPCQACHDVPSFAVSRFPGVSAHMGQMHIGRLGQGCVFVSIRWGRTYAMVSKLCFAIHIYACWMYLGKVPVSNFRSMLSGRWLVAFPLSHRERMCGSVRILFQR